MESPKEPNMETWRKVSQRRRQAREHRGLGSQRGSISARKRVTIVKATERLAVTSGSSSVEAPGTPPRQWGVLQRIENRVGGTERALWPMEATQPIPLEREKELLKPRSLSKGCRVSSALGSAETQAGCGQHSCWAARVTQEAVPSGRWEGRSSAWGKRQGWGVETVVGGGKK